jgi:hypothetical protein
MYSYKCRNCGCSLDPGEGDLCEECAVENRRVSENKRQMERRVRTTEFIQMHIDDFADHNVALKR